MFARDLPCVCPFVCIRCYFDKQKPSAVEEITFKPRYEVGTVVRIKDTGSLGTVEFIDEATGRIDVHLTNGGVTTYSLDQVERQ